jgi:ABC-type multidrug transport system fused ATPase/permease subunit
LKDISFKVAENELLAVVGPVGAGKSSLLLTLLKEIPYITGDIEINGEVFYVSQEAWIFPSSIKQNILFGKEYDKERFNAVIKACNLKQVDYYLEVKLYLILFVTFNNKRTSNRFQMAKTQLLVIKVSI